MRNCVIMHLLHLELETALYKKLHLRHLLQSSFCHDVPTL